MENPDEASFCANCGIKLDDSPSPESTVIEEEDSDSSSSDNNGSFFKEVIVENPKRNFKRDPLLYFCCIFPLLFFGMLSMISDADHFIKGLNPADYETNYPEEFNDLDMNGDGKLEFKEVNYIVSHTPQDTLYDIFEKSDKDGNGYLTGYEYDVYKSKAEGNSYEADYRKLEEERERNASKSEGRKDYSSVNNDYINSYNNQEFDREEGYVLTCPYCGSEAIYETGGYYKCAECGASIYDPDDLELGYGEGYMELLVPVSLALG